MCKAIFISLSYLRPYSESISQKERLAGEEETLRIRDVNVSIGDSINCTFSKPRKELIPVSTLK